MADGTNDANSQRKREEITTSSEKPVRNPHKPLRRRKSDFEEDIRPGSTITHSVETSQKSEGKSEESSPRRVKCPTAPRKKRRNSGLRDPKCGMTKRPLRKRRWIAKEKRKNVTGKEGGSTEDNTNIPEYETSEVDDETDDESNATDEMGGSCQSVQTDDRINEGDTTENIWNQEENTRGSTAMSESASKCSLDSHSLGESSISINSEHAGDEDVFDDYRDLQIKTPGLPECPFYTLPSEKTVLEFDLGKST